MKHVSRLAIVAFGIIGLFSALPAAAGCGERCNAANQCGDPGNPWDGCYQPGHFCLDLPNCGWLASNERDQLIEAAQAGDRERIAEIAQKAGGLLRISVKQESGEVVTLYDGWALAGLPVPAVGEAVQLAATGQGACAIGPAATATETAPETTAEKAATVAPQE